MGLGRPEGRGRGGMATRGLHHPGGAHPPGMPSPPGRPSARHPPDRPGRVIGKNTVDRMRSGIMYGTAAMLDGMLDRVEEELGQPGHGGHGGWPSSSCPCAAGEIKLEKDLLLKGLNIIYQEERRQAGGGETRKKKTCS